MLGTRRCDLCWELERRIKHDPELARRILDKLEGPDGVLGTEAPSWWTLIFCDGTAGSVQVFHAQGVDPAALGRDLKRDLEWLRDYALLAAVPGRQAVATRDDAHSLAECTLDMTDVQHARGVMVVGTAATHPPCTVCGKPYAEHGTYPTCATHPYTADSRCGASGTLEHGKFVGHQCPGAACRNGCVRGGNAAGVGGTDGR